ncbi:MAG: NADH:ubiquinone reductase (Na(+)-transporting) subunit C [Cyclobacteriaceae bacterium]
MQRSNTYIIFFAIALTVILGGALSLTSVGLKPLQDKQVELDTKKKILGAVMDISGVEDPDEILRIYNEKVKSIVIDIDGNELSTDPKGNPYVAETVNIQKNSKLDPKDRAYPVFMFMGESGNVEAYIFPTFGAGLWDWISSYVAFGQDLNTIKGIAFDHKGETPGLGARITEPGYQSRFEGKKIFEGNDLVSVKVVKGEGNTGLSDHQVDGLSGATMTTKGVNTMLENYLECYSAYIKKVKSQNS